MAALAVAEAQMPRAARLLGAADKLRAASGTPLPVPERQAVEDASAAARAALGEAAWLVAFSAGQAATPEDIIAEALGEDVPRDDGAR
ncbi:MAG TPA: hypothetical protein VGK33_18950 [Chloroflexota bacterium]